MVPELLARLVEIAAALRERLDAAAAAVAPLPADTPALLAEWDETVVAVADALAAFAAEVGAPPPTWDDRDGAIAAHDRLTQLRDGSARRERLLVLADQLRTGTFAHRRPGRQQQLNESRVQAAEECARAAAATTPPDLGSPPAGCDWLVWAWKLPADEFDALVETVTGTSGALAALLENGHPDWWTPTASVVPAAELPEPPAAPPVPPRVEFVPPPVVSPPPAPVVVILPPPAPPVPVLAPPVPVPVEPEEPAPEPPPALRAMPPLPEWLTGIAAFERQFWIDPLTGQCVAATWGDAGFASAAGAALDRSLARVPADGTALGPAWVFAAALRDRELPAVRPETLATAADVWAEPHRTTVGLDPLRAHAIREGEEANAADLRLLLTLEAMRPTRDDLLYDPDLEKAVARAGFHNEHLREVVRGLLLFHALSDVDPLAQLRATLNKTAQTPVAPADVLRKREQLHKEVQRVSLNAGSAYVGGFQHCAAAWGVFMEEVRPKVKDMYDTGPARWDPEPITTWLNGLMPRYEDIADRHNARAKSRRMMNRVAERLVVQIRELNNLMKELHVSAPAQDSNEIGVLKARLRNEAEALRGTKEMAVPDEAVAWALLLRALKSAPPGEAAHPLDIPAGQFVAVPELLRLIPGPVAPPAGGPAELEPARYDQFAPPVKAAALLLAHGTPGDPVKAATWDDVAAVCRAGKRYDLLGTLLGTIPDADRKFAREAWNVSLTDLKRRQAAAARVWRDLVVLADAQRDTIKSVLAEASRAIEGDAEARPATDARLFRAWLGLLREELERRREENVAGWQAAVRAAGGPTAELKLRLLAEGRYADVTHPAARAADHANWRETAWRHEADRNFPNPRETLLGLLAPAPDKPLEVVAAWCEDAPASANRAKRVRVQFARWLLGDLYDKHAVPDTPVLRIKTEYLRHSLASRQPTFAPQMHDAQWLALVVPLAKPADTDFLQKATGAIAQHGENAITVLLCPGLTAVRRDDLLRELHAREAFAAVLDDLDLCRLLNPGGVNQPDRVLGLFELILEQQLWARRSPFSVAEGGDMRLEMYVGRRDEAEKLATRGDYTRIFSGRKLGKTALLHYVRLTWNNRELPNGRLLRVVYVGIAGVRSESRFAMRVLEELRVEFPGAVLPVAHYTADTFIDTLRLFLRDHPKDNLLIVLDEADEFVLAQVEEYGTVRKEAALSFRLRSENYGEPNDRRVRCVYTGYRATNTYEGVWVNAGDPLLLSPLSPEEAAALIGRPLARMGIDASEQADAIAFRCGYQPAVLLRFGVRLMRRLADGGYRGQVVVGPDDVTEVCEEEYVQEEIRRVVRANFQGNPLGQAVFAVVLDRLSRLPPGYGIQQAEKEVLDAFRECWQPPPVPGPPPAPDALSQFKDLEDRKLLVRLPAGGGHRLTFPHHLTTLLSGLDTGKEIRANLLAWHQQTKSDPAAGRPGEFRGPLHRSDMLLVRELIGGELKELTPSAAVVGSLWLEGLDAPTGGLGERLGLDPTEVGNAAGLPPGAPLGGRRVWQNAGAELLGRVLADPPEQKPLLLTGGADLLRQALRDLRARPGEVEALGPSRLTNGRVRWWFQRVRGVEFSGERVYNDVFQLTGGVPFLVGLYDRLILANGPPADGRSMTAGEEEEAGRQFKARLAKDTFGLTDGPPAARLEPRELELVRMVHVASTTDPGAADPGEMMRDVWSADLFGDGWQGLYPGRDFPPPYGAVPGDAVALQLLLLLGVLPFRAGAGGGGQVGTLAAGDPILAIWPRLG